MTKKNIGRFLFKILGILAFMCVSFFALFLAYGYQADLSSRHIQKTSIIDITSRYKNVRVFLDSKLMSNELPYQIKGILSGSYLLSLQKTNYWPWRRELQVQNDLVTKVHDVLLVPYDLKPFIKTVNTFLPDTRYFMGSKGFVSTRPDQDFFTLISFFPDGTLKHDEVPFAFKDFKDIVFLDDGVLIIFFQGSSIRQAIDVSTLDTFTFEIPDHFEELTINFLRRMIYFMKDGILYGIPFAEFNDFEPSKVENFKIISNIEKFTFTANGIYYLSAGKLFFADLEGNNPRIIDRFSVFTNLSVRHGKDYDFLVLRRGEQRYLFVVGPKGIPLLLTSLLRGDYKMNALDEVLFLTTQNKLMFYDPHLQKRQMVYDSAEDFDLLGWYGQDHYVFLKEQELQLADVSFSNAYGLGLIKKTKTQALHVNKPFNGEFEQAYVSNTSVYFLKDLKLKVLSFL